MSNAMQQQQMRVRTASTTTPANAETHNARTPLRPTMGRNRTPKTHRAQTNGGKPPMILNPQLSKIENPNVPTPTRQDTDNTVTTVSKTNNADGNPPPPRKGETNRTTQRPEGRDLTSGTLQTPNLQTPKPTTTTTTTTTTQNRRQRRKNTKNKPYLQTPIKPHSTHKTAERLQTMTPNKKHQNTKRGTHIKIGKLTVTQNRTTHITNQNQTHNNRRKQTMTTEAQIWKKINEPKIEGLITNFDKNGKPTYVFRILDRIPKITRKRR